MSGSFNPVNFMSTAALGALTGGASIYAQIATQLYAQMGSQLVQQMGQQLGMPQGAIDIAQMSFSASTGNTFSAMGAASAFSGGNADLSQLLNTYGQSVGASPSEIGDAQRQTNDFMRQIVSQMSESSEFREAKANRGGGSGTNAPGWLMAMAEALGRKLDAMARDMETKAANISEKDPSSSAEFGVVSQQFSMLMNATNTAIKTIGEALGGMARKQ